MRRQIAPSHRTIRVEHKPHRMNTTSGIHQIAVVVLNYGFVGLRLHFHGHEHRPRIIKSGNSQISFFMVFIEGSVP